MRYRILFRKEDHMKAFITKMVPIKTTDRFSFRCSQCGACCRRVRESVPLESLDAFRLAKFFRDSGEKVRSIDDVLAAYAEPVLLHESGYLVFMLKTVGEDDACIFLKENKCTIHSVNPRACRTYPISVGPDAKGGYEQFISMEQPHHNTGPQMSVKKWIQKRCSNQDFAFWDEEYSTVQEIARLLEKVPECDKPRAMMLFIHYKYSNFDLDKSFINQYNHNNSCLIAALRRLAGKR